MSLFEGERKNLSEEFKNLRDLDQNLTLRQNIDRLWEKFVPFAESDFVENFSRETNQRFWEMYLGVGLLNAGLVPEKKAVKGPDFKTYCNGKMVWFEAVAASAGTKADAVPGVIGREDIKSIRNKVKLRFSSVLSEKRRKYKTYMDSDLVGVADCAVIAVNGFGIGYSIYESNVPAIVSVLFPLGDQYVLFDQTGSKFTDTGFTYRGHINKRSGAGVSTKFFEENPEISGVVSSNASAGTVPTELSKVGCDFCVIHNPNAINPLPDNIFPLADHYLVKGTDLIRTSIAK